MNAVERSRLDQITGYAFRAVEDFIAECASRSQLPEIELARGVGTLLCSKAGGQILGPVDSLPHLQEATARTRNPVQPVALAKRASRGAQGEVKPVYDGWTGNVVAEEPVDGRHANGTRLSDKGREILSKKMKQRWAEAKAAGKNIAQAAGRVWHPAITRIQFGRKVRVKGYWAANTNGRSYKGHHWMQLAANRARKDAHVRKMRKGMNRMLRASKQ